VNSVLSNNFFSSFNFFLFSSILGILIIILILLQLWTFLIVDALNWLLKCFFFTIHIGERAFVILNWFFTFSANLHNCWLCRNWSLFFVFFCVHFAILNIWSLIFFNLILIFFIHYFSSNLFLSWFLINFYRSLMWRL
jgi:hypothetical protein